MTSNPSCFDAMKESIHAVARECVENAIQGNEEYHWKKVRVLWMSEIQFEVVLPDG